MKELFIKYKVFKHEGSIQEGSIQGVIEWDIVLVEQGVSVKETVKNFETHILFGRDYYDVEIISINLV